MNRIRTKPVITAILTKANTVLTTAPTATNRKTLRPRTAAPALSPDRAIVFLRQHNDLRLRHTDTGWCFAQLTDGDRRLFFRLGGKNFERFLKERVFPRASDRFVARLVRRCRFLAWLRYSPSLQ